MINKIDRHTLQKIFIESLSDNTSFQIISGLNPFYIKLEGKEFYIYIKNLSPAYFANSDIWRVQLPKKDEFDNIRDSNVDFVLLGYDADNDVYTTWNSKWTKQRLNIGESVSFYSRFSLQEEAANSKSLRRLSLNNDGEVIAFPREYLDFILMNLKTFFDDSDYVAVGSKRRTDANEAYKILCDVKNIDIMNQRMRKDAYSEITISNYSRAIKLLIGNGYFNKYKKIFLSCNTLETYPSVIAEFINQPDINEINEKWHNTLSAALKSYLIALIAYRNSGNVLSSNVDSENKEDDSNENVSSEKVVEESNNIDWEELFTGEDGKLIRIANPILLDKLRPHLSGEYKRPIVAYNEIEEFYGDRYLNMDMGDWMRLFNAIDWTNPYYNPNSLMQSKTKSRKEILRVEYPDGRVVQYPKAIDTYIEIIENNFPDLIHELKIVHAGINIVSKELSEQYASTQHMIKGGWYVFTNSNTRKKRLDLLKISEELDLNLKVDIVSCATGEIIICEDEIEISKRKKIQVTFPDGKVMMSNKVLETLVEVVKYAGPENVRSLNIIVCKDNLILKNPKSRYIKTSKPVGDGWLVNTCSDTLTKYEQIKTISEKLGLGLKLEIM